MIEDYSNNSGILPLLTIVVCVAVAMITDDGWLLGIYLVVIFLVYRLVVAPTVAKSKYKSRRKSYDKKIKNFKPYVGDSLTDETKKKIYDNYKYDPKNLFHNTKHGMKMFDTLKKQCCYPRGAIPDPDNYDNNYVVGNVIELTGRNPKHMQYNIEYKGMVYELNGSYYKAECLGKRMPTVENVKMYGYGGTKVHFYGTVWDTPEHFKVRKKVKRH